MDNRYIDKIFIAADFRTVHHPIMIAETLAWITIGVTLLARLRGLEEVMRLEPLILRHRDQKVGTTGFFNSMGLAGF